MRWYRTMLNEVLKKLKDIQNKWKKTKKDSAPGTLSHSEASLALNALEKIKTELEAQSISELNDSILEETAGGSKVLSAALAAVTALSSMPSTSAALVSKHTAPPSSISLSKNLEIKSKEFYKNHPKLIKGTAGTAVATGGALVAAGSSFGAAKGAKRYLLGDVDKMSNEEAFKELEKEIKKLESRGNEGSKKYFEVEGEEEYKKNPKLFLVYMREINRVFDAHPPFAKMLINHHRNNGTKFNIGFIPGTPHPIADMIFGKVGEEGHFDGFGRAYSSLRGIELANYPINLLLAGGNVVNKTGHHSSMDYKRILPAVATHELGHILQWSIMKDKTGESEENMKKEIIEIAKKKQGENISEKISTYGEDVREWFAEVFAHSECCSNPNPLGQAMKEYLSKKISGFYGN